MELRVLKYFLMAAREENITRAAKLLHITQPTLSRQLMQLEEELGTKLFKRGKHNIYLTEDGMLLKKRAQDIVALADRTEREFKEQKEELAGEIIIGCGESRSMDELAESIADFQKMYPMVQYELYTANADDVKEKLDKGLLDLGMVTEPVDISKYNFIRMKRREEWGVLVRTDSALAEKGFATPEDLAEIPLIMVKRDLVKNELESWFAEYYPGLHVTGTYNLLNNAAIFVQKGIGAAICFEVGNHYDNLTFVPMKPTLHSGCVLIWRKNEALSETVKKFLDVFSEKRT